MPSTEPQLVRRKVTIVLVVKLLAVLALFVAFFGPSQRPDVDTERLRERLLETGPTDASGARR